MRRETTRLLAMSRGPLPVWLALKLLLAATVEAADLPLGRLRIAMSLAIAAVQVGLIVVFFMNLRTSGPLLRLTAPAGVFWLILMFLLTFSDYVVRPPSSPCQGPGTQFATQPTTLCDSAVP
jgi:cytochrome c oxidase subunit 4